MKATKLRAAKPWVLVMLLVFLSCLFGTGAQAQDAQVKEVLLTKGKTVSHIALELTRNANNWRKPEIKVFRVVKGERILIGKSRYTKLLVGDIVSVPTSMVATREVKLQGRTISEFCAEYKEANCVRSIRAINSLSNDAAMQKLHRTIYVPTAFTRIEKPAVQAAAPSTTRAVAPPVVEERKLRSTWWFRMLQILVLGIMVWIAHQLFVRINFRVVGGMAVSFWRRFWRIRKTEEILSVVLRDFNRRVGIHFPGEDWSEYLKIDPINHAILLTPGPFGPNRKKIQKVLYEYSDKDFDELWQPIRGSPTHPRGSRRLTWVLNDLSSWRPEKVSDLDLEREMREFGDEFIAAFQASIDNSATKDSVEYGIEEVNPRERFLLVSMTPVGDNTFPNNTNHFSNSQKAVVVVLRKLRRSDVVVGKYSQVGKKFLIRLDYELHIQGAA